MIMRGRQMKILLLFFFPLATNMVVFAQDPAKLAPRITKCSLKISRCG